MRKEKIYFPDQQTFCVFPNQRSELPQAIADLNLKDRYAVIVLIGGDIDEHQAVATLQAVKTISKIAEEMHIVIVCGGTNMGVMAEVGQIRRQQHYKFPLVGVAPEGLVAWPGGPHSTKFLWWGEKRWQLESHYSHFILVPGNQFGDESPWIVDTATALSKDHRSVTILINGGEISRKDINLSLEQGRPVIALSHTGRLADEFATQPDRNKLITVIPANNEQLIVEAVRELLSSNESSTSAQSLSSAMQFPIR
jgi:hypothetical protein